MESCKSRTSCDTCYDESDVTTSSASLTSSRSENVEENACCFCNYDPFEDDSPEYRIKDLDFALKKLYVMKCQMKKWRLERLQLESQNRSLKIALQDYVEDVDAVLKPDPLLVHLRTDNARLNNCKDELEDKIRDLTEILEERECSYSSPCDAVAHVREKMMMIRHRFAVEKRQLRETIANLQLRLEETKEEGSGAALNRLRGKLRELMKAGKKDGSDQQVSTVVEKSIDTMLELSKGCDALKRDNEKLLAEIEALKKEIKEDVAKRENQEKCTKNDELKKESVDISDLSKRVKTCECLVTQMRLQLAEKDDIINDLQKKLYCEKRNSTKLEHDLDQINVSHKALTTDISAMKTELKEKDDKITQLLRDLRQATCIAANVTELESELECLRTQLRELELCRDQLLEILNNTKQDLLNKDNQLACLMEEFNKKKEECENHMKKMTAEHSDWTKMEKELKCENNKLLKKIEEMTNEKDELCQRLSEIDILKEELEKTCSENKKLENDMKNLQVKLADEIKNVERLKGENAKLKDELEKSKIEARQERSSSGDARSQNEKLLKRLKELENDIKKLESERNVLRDNLDKQKTKSVEAQAKVNELKNENSSLKKTNDELSREINFLKASLEKVHLELKKFKDSNEAIKKELDNMKIELATSRKQNEQLSAAGDAAKKNNIELQNKINNLSRINDQLKAELDQLKPRLNELTRELNELTVEKNCITNTLGRERDEYEKLKKELDESKKWSSDLQDKLNSAINEKDRLEREVGDHKWQVDKFKNDMETEVAAKGILEEKLKSAYDELEMLKSSNTLLCKEIEKLTKECDELSAEIISSQNEIKLLNTANKEFKYTDREKLSDKERFKSDACMSRKRSVQIKSESSKLRSSAENLNTSRDGSGDLSLATEALKCQIVAQIKAIDRIREYINYIEGKVTEKPEMANECYPSNNKDWPLFEMNELFKKLRILSEAIFNAEQEIQNLEYLAHEFEKTRESSEQPEKTNNHGSKFDANAWLQSLTLTELDELHDRVCLLTSNMKRDDKGDDNYNNEDLITSEILHEECDCDVDETREELNTRIVTLQKRIAERTADMKKLLLLEKTQAVKSSDEVLMERPRNLILHYSKTRSTQECSPTSVIFNNDPIKRCHRK